MKKEEIEKFIEGIGFKYMYTGSDNLNTMVRCYELEIQYPNHIDHLKALVSPSTLSISENYNNEKSFNYERLTKKEFEKQVMDIIGKYPLKFIIDCTMKIRWIPYFLSFLDSMERNGNIGHSSTLAFYADGDGDFRPKFKTNVEFPEAKTLKSYGNDFKDLTSIKIEDFFDVE